MSVRIIVDSSADVAERFQKRLCVVPLTIHFGSEELIDGVTIDKAHFYQRLVESDQLPTTSQATPAAFQKVYEQTVQAGDSAVVITLSGKLSGTYQSACIAAEEFDHVYVVDSQTAAIGTGILAEYALSCVDAGMPADEIAAQLEQKREDVCLVALLDTLEYLQKGGRIGKVAALLGSAISLKPIISCNEEGAYYPIAKAIGRTPSIRKVMELAQKFAEGCPKVMLAIMHGGAAEEAEALVSEIKKKIPQGTISVFGQISPALGVHTGPGLIGVCVLREC